MEEEGRGVLRHLHEREKYKYVPLGAARLSYVMKAVGGEYSMVEEKAYWLSKGFIITKDEVWGLEEWRKWRYGSHSI